MDILIAGGGVAGLTLALSLHQAGIACRVFEAAPALRPLGVGINLLPHAMRELTELGLQAALAQVAVETREVCLVNRFGQFIHREPRGRSAGYAWPQLSIHRADLHAVLFNEVTRRMGEGTVALGKRVSQFREEGERVTVEFEDGTTAEGDALVGCDGIHSRVRERLFPERAALSYQGINMWRGVTRWKPFLGGDCMIIGGWLEVGKLVVYPIRRELDAQGRQLLNWVAEIQSPRNVMQDWALPGRLEDFLPAFDGWRFEWLDAVAMMQAAEVIYEYPMVDREPLPAWTTGRITLAGDAAHPMHPRGSNGAGQAILDVRVLAGCLKREGDVLRALSRYEGIRLKQANAVVLANRSAGPDAILRLVHERTGDRPFGRVEDVVSAQEIRALAENYQRVAGFEREALARRGPLV